MKKLAIIGPGLLGGSIALAARERIPGAHLRIWARRKDALAAVEKIGVANVVSSDFSTVVTGAELVILCVPIGSMESIARAIVMLVDPETVITDVGSVKGAVIEKLAPIFQNRAHFIGSHPMAGSEKAGLEAARANLFEDAICMVTPEPGCAAEKVEILEKVWTSLGARTRLLSASEHDEIVALVSHLPHLLAATLVNLVCAENADSINFSGNGFRDTTRIAAGPPAMWAEILRSNRVPLRRAVQGMIEQLRASLANLDDANSAPLESFLEKARAQRVKMTTGETNGVLENS